MKEHQRIRDIEKMLDLYIVKFEKFTGRPPERLLLNSEDYGIYINQKKTMFYRGLPLYNRNIY